MITSGSFVVLLALALRHNSAPLSGFLMAGQDSEGQRPLAALVGRRRSGNGWRTQWRPTSNLRGKGDAQMGNQRSANGLIYLTTVAISCGGDSMACSCCGVPSGGGASCQHWNSRPRPAIPPPPPLPPPFPGGPR